MKPSHPEKDNPRGGCVASSADKAAAQPEKGAPGKGERRSPSPVEDATDGGVIEEVERTGAEERIRFQAELLDRVGEAVIALDLEGRVVYWNRAAEGLYGWSSEEVMGRNLTEMVVPDDLRGRAEQVKRQVIETGNWLGEFVVRRKDGTCFPVVANNTLVHDEQGNVGGVISVLRDVTEDKRAEEGAQGERAALPQRLRGRPDRRGLGRYRHALPQGEPGAV